ncbi:FixH family protein [Bacillus sp. V59.32b]|uniref:FixH family protein n=1 Tax=Bacillus sp. V59.32b TaxID=1758642 RepID=UPI000E3CCD8C|nr:FixH family protein [Bacillus sp. V59.32b]RFU62692.1 hypothetical protein D0463_13000 [Bacillus sp. V59.32b]
MVMRKLMYVLLFLFLVLAGCGDKEKEQGGDMPQVVEVQFNTDPKDIKSNETVKLMATVVQGKEKVTDADKVEFEIWKEGENENQHTKQKAKHEKNGIYAISYTFKEPGTYYVISHTTARRSHTMPQNKIQVK